MGLALLAILAAGAWSLRRSPDPLPGFPNTILFADDRAEDLRFLDPKTTGVAYLARTVILGATGIVVRPRLSPLQYPPGTTLMAVVRIEFTDRALPPYANVIPVLLPAAAGAAGLQIDFDEADRYPYWYQALLTDLRRALPAGKPLSIAVKASWCSAGSWVDGLPVAEATPLLFRAQGDPVLPICRSSSGVWNGDRPPNVRRLYWFHPLPWTAAAVEKISAR